MQYNFISALPWSPLRDDTPISSRKQSRSRRASSMASPKPKAPKRELKCPVFQADIILNRAHTCNGIGGDSMSKVRQHMIRSRHLPFLRLCKTCNTDFVDRHVFEQFHGTKGELCHISIKQQRAKGQEAQWEALYRMVMQMEATGAPPEEPSLAETHLPPTLNAISEDIQDDAQGELPTPTPDAPSRSYITPYQLIFDSDSEHDARTGAQISSVSKLLPPYSS
ncbi:hypothetical protein K458DRAFT_52813 [Lentithecium fluviatile CBS 122367]|uniref:Uncharacterized protein n=1 Tax=Lentithecium fluviatile CBS 122367 TaxID=1168545 RepID=A0A6G1IWY2_9PLEO|nr:hypothetical protein K458DRAFT_52813 [Lentithecium fluviatile CBS 122367]